MKLKSKYDKKEDVPEALLDFYQESNGVWVLDSDLEQPDPRLKGDLATERRRRQELEGKIKKWEELGLDETQIAEMVARDKERSEKDLEAKGQWESLKAQLVEQQKQ